MDKQVHRQKFLVDQGVGKLAKQLHQTVGTFEGVGGLDLMRCEVLT